MNYLELYHKWMLTGRIPTFGLCGFFGLKNELFNLLTPVVITQANSDEWQWYWAYNGKPIQEQVGFPSLARATEFTPMRQNIVLLMAAMNGDL